MLYAIHKKTGKRVEAFKLRTDPSWIGTDKDKWIAPTPEIANWQELNEKGIQEVDVCYVKAHQRERDGKISEVQDYFRITTEGAIDKSESESEEHKLAKEGVYYDLVDDKIIILHGNQKLVPSSFGNFKLEIEERLSRNKKAKIGDVVMTFEKEDNLLGKGIVFEIQLSSQNGERTEERTYDRILQGYSVVWLWQGMFKDNKLKDLNVRVIPFRNSLKDYDGLRNSEINSLSQKVDDKIYEVIGELNNKEIRIKEWMEKSLDSVNSNLNEIRRLKANLSSILSEKVEGVEEKTKEILELCDKEKERYSKELDIINSIKNVENQKELKIIEEKIKKLVEESIRLEEYNLEEFIKKKADGFVLEYFNKITTSEKLEKIIKERFGTEVGDFLRTNIHSLVYEELKNRRGRR